MLDLALIRGEPARVLAALARRGVEASAVNRRRSRGLLRLHTFETVELYALAAPGDGPAELQRAVEAAAGVPEALGLAVARRRRAARALSQAAAATWDVAVWAPGTEAWLTVGSVSSFTDYQARRTGTRVAGAGGRRFVHTVGGAAVALPRLIAALLEQGQQADGRVRLPEALAAGMGGAVLAAAG